MLNWQVRPVLLPYLLPYLQEERVQNGCSKKLLPVYSAVFILCLGGEVFFIPFRLLPGKELLRYTALRFMKKTQEGHSLRGSGPSGLPRETFLLKE